MEADLAATRATAQPKSLLRYLSLKSVVGGIVIILGLWAIYQIQAALSLVLISMLISIALHPFIAWLTERKIPKGISIAAVFILFLLLLAFLAFSLGSILISQGEQLIQHFPQYITMATDRLKTIPFLNNQQTDILQSLNHQLSSAAEKSSVFLLSGVTYLLGVVGSVFSIFTILIFTYFFLAEADYFQKLFSDLLPAKKRKKVLGIVAEIIREVGGYVRGQLIVVSITGLIVGLVLTILGVPFSYLQGILVALLDIIPVIGPMIALTIGVIITLGAKVSLVPWVILTYLGAQQIENALVFPQIMQRSVNLHPFWILLSIFLVSALIGVTGVIFAVPIAIICRVLIVTLYLKKETKAA
jgi:predicted PurR-regulated permease PerM